MGFVSRRHSDMVLRTSPNMSDMRKQLLLAIGWCHARSPAAYRHEPLAFMRRSLFIMPNHHQRNPCAPPCRAVLARSCITSPNMHPPASPHGVNPHIHGVAWCSKVCCEAHQLSLVVTIKVWPIERSKTSARISPREVARLLRVSGMNTYS